MLNRRVFGRLAGATALSTLAAPAIVSRTLAQGSAPTVPRGNYLIKNGQYATWLKAYGLSNEAVDTSLVNPPR